MGFADEFRDAWNKRDHAAMMALFAPDARLRSPIITTPFTTREQIAALFRSLFDNMPPVEFTVATTLDDGRELVMWRTTFGDGTELEGMDVMTLDEGRIREVTVMMRPLVGTAAFLKAVSPDLARARSATHARVIKGVNVGFAANAKMTDRMAPRFLP
jgi:ketosteroid isomerase-like protein